MLQYRKWLVEISLKSSLPPLKSGKRSFYYEVETLDELSAKIYTCNRFHQDSIYQPKLRKELADNRLSYWMFDVTDVVCLD